jgi:hypothetical protein
MVYVILHYLFFSHLAPVLGANGAHKDQSICGSGFNARSEMHSWSNFKKATRKQMAVYDCEMCVRCFPSHIAVKVSQRFYHPLLRYCLSTGFHL